MRFHDGSAYGQPYPRPFTLVVMNGWKSFACLILDHHIPNMTGLELARRLRADGAVVPILLITGSPSPTIAAELGIEVLDKPAVRKH
jgi:CheY-like chemotaxis protein